jgi:flagellin-like hook-associated protein FlgL
MVTSIVSNNSYSFAAYTLKNNSSLRDISVSRISSGSNSAAGQNGGQVDSLSLRVRTTVSADAKIVGNIGNALSFLDAQASSLTHIASLVGSMGEIASKMQDFSKSANDLSNYMQEFQALRLQLTNERNATYGDQSLHDKFGSSSPFSVNLNNQGTQSIAFSKSDFTTNGGGAWDTLIGAATVNLEITDAAALAALDAALNTPAVDNSTEYSTGDSNTGTPASGSTSTVDANASLDPTGSEGEGTANATMTAKEILGKNWGVHSFEALYSGVSAMISNNSIQQSALRNSLDAVTSRGISMVALEDKITGADVAHEVASLAKSQLMNQSASSALAQTNLTAQGVIKALWGEPSSGIEWYKPEPQQSILPKISFV